MSRQILTRAFVLAMRAPALALLAAINILPAAYAQTKTESPPPVEGAQPVTIEHVKLHSGAMAAHPPMGWNSYDAYGTTITEAQFRANVRWMSQHLAHYGWRYAVIDAEWFVRNPTPNGNGAAAVLVLDSYGRYVPATNRFPSAAGGAGFKPLADYVHSLGLKFGIHILRGIPREAVARNLPIEGSPYTAAQAVDIHSACPWNADNYGVDPHRPAGQAYYDSIARLYASWDVDFVKADCIASHPYAAAEIRMLSSALQSSGRNMIFSLSPGPAPIEKLPQLRRYANMWRISNDVWDLWHSSNPYPQGVGDEFPRAARRSPDPAAGPMPTCSHWALCAQPQAGASRGARN